MVQVNESHTLITGGIKGSSNVLASAFLFSEETGFTKIEDLKTKRFSHGCSVINDNMVMVAGGLGPDWGSSTEYLNLATLTWAAGPLQPGVWDTQAEMTGSILISGNNMFKLEGLSHNISEWHWVELEEMKHERRMFWAGVVSNKLCK